MPESSIIVHIEDHHLKEFNKSINSLNKKAEKYQIPNFDLINHGKMAIGYVTKEWKPINEIATEDLPRIIDEKMVNVFEVYWHKDKLTLPGGWKFSGIVEREKGSEFNSVRLIPGSEPISHNLRYDPLHCDHCAQNRGRHKVFILHDKEGTEKTVGSACINEYLNNDVLKILEKWDDLIPKIKLFSTVPSEPSLKPARVLSAESLLYVAADEIVSSGYFSRKTIADKGLNRATTSFNVIYKIEKNDHAFDYNLINKDLHKSFVEDTMLECKGYADRILKKDSTLTDTEYMLGLVGINGKARHEDVGLLCWNIAKRMIEERKKDMKDSEYFGEVGKRDVFTLTARRMHEKLGDYGTTYIISGVQEGTDNLFTWFCSNYCTANDSGLLQHGDVNGHPVKIKGTVSEHKIDKFGKKVTYFKRIALFSEKDKK